MEIKKLACELESWAQEKGWKTVTQLIPENGAHITFVMPMPQSWSKKKRASMDCQPHQQKPDLDNLTKSLLDALFEDDSHIWDARTSKVWGETGMIIIENIGEKNA